jgi:fucose permease
VTTQAIPLDANAAARKRYLLVLLSFGFVMTGLEITLLGPLLPQFIARWSLNDAQVALFFPVEFGCSLAGVWLASLLTRYFGTRVPLIAGYFLMAAGLGLVNASSMTSVLVALALLGLAYGLVVPGTNLTVAKVGGARSASHVSLVNFAWGAGALSCSPMVALALKKHILPQTIYGAAVFTLLLTGAFFFARFPEAKHATVESNMTPAPSVGVGNTVALAALFFLYVGVEVSLGNWATEHTKRLIANGEGLATVAPMFFYGGLMTGRALAPVILARIREYRLVLSALLLAFAATAVVITAKNQATAFAALVLAGLGCATIFPIYVAWLSRWYGRNANRVSGLMFSMSSVGSAIGPWLVGVLSTHAGGLRIGLLVPLASVAGMLGLLLLVRRQATA